MGLLDFNCHLLNKPVKLQNYLKSKTHNYLFTFIGGNIAGMCEANFFKSWNNDKGLFFYHKKNTDLLYQCVKYIARQVDISCFITYVIHFEITEDLCDLIGSQKFDLIMDHASFL